MRRLLLAGAVLLAAPAHAAKDKAPAEAPAPAPIVSAGPSDDAAKAAFADYEAQLATGQKARAADALVVILDDPAKAPFHALAATRLGDLFGELSLPYAATLAYARGFTLADPTNTADIGQRVPRAIEYARQVGDLAALEAPFAKNVGLAQNPEVRGELAYLAARESARQGNLGVALGILKMVQRGDAVYASSKALEGIVLSQQERWQDALAALQDAQKAGGGTPEFQQVLGLNLGRAYYGAGNYPQAMRLFASVPRESDHWPEAQFERAWAHFRVDDFNGALANLLSLDNPFFADFYYPEADLLRVYSMFLMCKLPEAEKGIAAFGEKYQPMKELLGPWTSRTEAEFFEAARKFRTTGDTSGLPKMVLRPWAGEERFGASLEAIAKAEDELTRLKNVAANPFSERARAWVTERRDALVRAEGARIKARLVKQHSDISTMLTDVKIFSVDVGDLNAKILRLAADIGQMPVAAENIERKEPLRKGWREWPYEGEVWADELGYYRVSTVPECPAALRQSVK